ncbi:hypothetical protein Defa_21010 [Desulfovibrio sp. TH_2024_36128]|uniref:Bacteriophage protein n=1 Tax=Desulfovibrio falkowii TaxID=3136602 RepID=A0ABQ0E9Y2_9BACT
MVARVTQFPHERCAPVDTSITATGHTKFCRHSRILIDKDNHEVECKDCGKTLDPFEVLLGYADSERKHKREIARLEAAQRAMAEIQSAWSFTQQERRRINRAMDDAKHEDTDNA